MGVDWGAAAEGGDRRTDRSGAGGQVYMVGARDGTAVRPLCGCGRDFEF